MTESLLESYEAAPYDSRPIFASHIGGLAAVAHLRGVRSTPPDRCRVLELGCGTGENLLPMAIEYPQSMFLGIDLSPRHIAAGETLRDLVGVGNLTLRAASILDIADDLGQFDYIICHGVYSWVPPEVQDAILAVCSRNLAPNGVAYVSYNTYPGWHVRMMVREMLLEHDDPTLPPAERVSRARAFGDLLATAEPERQTLHMASIRQEILQLRTQTDVHLLHEQLEPFNAPVYFIEFMRRAASHGLQYLSESPLWENRAALGSGLVAALGELDPIRSEQYGDYMLGRMFRRTLLCHEGDAVSPAPDVNVVPELHALIRANRVPPSVDDAARGEDVRAFQSLDGLRLTTNNPLVIVTLDVVGEGGPTTLSFPEILTRVRSRFAPSPDGPSADDAPAIAQVLLELATAGLVVLRTTASSFAGTVSERPVASPLARLQATGSDHISGMLHGAFRPTRMDVFLLRLLDGTHDRSQLVAAVDEALASGELAPTEDLAGDPLPEGARFELSAEEIVDGVLERMRSLALLVA